MRGLDKRLDRLRGRVTAAPILPGVLDEAYEWFTSFGELPETHEEDHVALAVIRRAANGGKDRPPPTTKHDFAEQLREALHDPATDRPTVRAELFKEALHEQDHVRRVARGAIAVEVAYDGDVESPGFGAHHGLPMFGTVGMHVLGYPRKWIAPPYEYEGARLLTRYDELRARIDQRNPKWFEPIGDALLAFRTRGELPADDFMLELVLADAELDVHRLNSKGTDVAELMGWFQVASRAEGAELQEALDQICAVVRERRLPL